MPNARTGHCQCDAVRYCLTGEPLTLFACHCTDCQRQSSSAFGMALWVRKADVEMLSGEMKEWVRELPSGRRMACRFCPDCGTRLFHQVLGQEEVMSIKPGTLEDTRGLQPVGHIWTSRRQPWVQLDEGSLHYPGNPDNFEALLGAWHAASAAGADQP
ncbi:GFA family protein [Azohydromonas australica]|uniref:GFA family protein n=1 Tax=Azohydromonas australica TaxID=364039 RepID=UPI0006849331|nr:GFA family protein [Azohydromonas australica]